MATTAGQCLAVLGTAAARGSPACPLPERAETAAAPAGLHFAAPTPRRSCHLRTAPLIAALLLAQLAPGAQAWLVCRLQQRRLLIEICQKVLSPPRHRHCQLRRGPHCPQQRHLLHRPRLRRLHYFFRVTKTSRSSMLRSRRVPSPPQLAAVPAQHQHRHPYFLQTPPLALTAPRTLARFAPGPQQALARASRPAPAIRSALPSAGTSSRAAAGRTSQRGSDASSAGSTSAGSSRRDTRSGN